MLLDTPNGFLNLQPSQRPNQQPVPPKALVPPLLVNISLAVSFTSIGRDCEFQWEFQGEFLFFVYEPILINYLHFY